jgi:hypothetical protein
MVGPYMPMQGHPDMSMYQMPMSQEVYYNDNRSMYSGSTQMSSQSIVNTGAIKKKLNEEINTVLSGCIENIIPKLVEECADNIYLRISLELDKQAKDIEDIKNRIAGFEEDVAERCKFGKTSTPLKNLKKMTDDINYVNGMVKDQTEKMSHVRFGQSEDTVDCIKKYMVKLKENLEAEKRMTEEMSNSVKEKNVDIVAMKRMLENKVHQISENMRNVGTGGESTGLNGSKFDEILGLLNTIKEKTATRTRMSYEYQPLETSYVDSESSDYIRLADVKTASPKKENICMNANYGSTVNAISNYHQQAKLDSCFLKPSLTQRVENPPKVVQKKTTNLKSDGKAKNPFLMGSKFAF